MQTLTVPCPKTDTLCKTTRSYATSAVDSAQTNPDHKPKWRDTSTHGSTAQSHTVLKDISAGDTKSGSSETSKNSKEKSNNSKQKSKDYDMSSAKTLCQAVLEGHFTRETLEKVIKYDHDSWEQVLNQYIRQHLTEWDLVTEFAKKLATQYLKNHKDEQLSKLIR